MHCNKRVAPSLQLEKACVQQWRPIAAKNKFFLKRKEILNVETLNNKVIDEKIQFNIHDSI